MNRIAAIIASVAFVVAFIGALLVKKPNVPGISSSLEAGGLAAGLVILVFGAIRILVERDRGNWKAVRNKLMARSDVCLEEFIQAFPGHDAALIAEIRDEIALLFNVPSTKIYPYENFFENFKSSKSGPAFHTAVMFHILHRRNVTLPERFSMYIDDDLNSIGNLAREIEKVLSQKSEES